VYTFEHDVAQCEGSLLKVTGQPQYCLSSPPNPTAYDQIPPRYAISQPDKPNLPQTFINMSSTNQYDAPSGDVVDDDYKSRTGQSAIPVQSDGAKIEATEYDNGGDSDRQLGMFYLGTWHDRLLTLCREGRKRRH
jgi:hypothetical protein